MGGVVLGVVGVIYNSQCTGFGQYTTQVTLVVCKRTAIKVKTKAARVGANPAQSDLSCVC